MVSAPATGPALAGEPAVVSTSAEWDGLAQALPGAHLLQSWEWGEFKRRTAWHPRRLAWPAGTGAPVAAAQVLARTAARVLRVLYVPRGPLLDWADPVTRTRVLAALEALTRRERAILLKIDPDVAVGFGVPGAEPTRTAPLPGAFWPGLPAELAARGWRESAEQVQFRNTVRLDLRRSEAEILAGMKQKTRYNLRLAERKGVTVRPGALADLDLLYRLYAETAVRDGFVIRPQAYYHDAWGRFIAAGLAQPLIAEVEGQPVGALIVYRYGRTAWYLYGMSREAHRDKMPNHLLQWRAITWARAHGCEVYDFWGAPSVFAEHDRLWGVWKFKEGFGGTVVRSPGAWDYAPNAALYRLYTTVLPRLLAIWRRRGRRQTQASLEN